MLSERARERNDSRSLSVVRERESLLHGNTNTLATAARPYCFWESLRESKVTARFIQVFVCVCVCDVSAIVFSVDRLPIDCCCCCWRSQSLPLPASSLYAFCAFRFFLPSPTSFFAFAADSAAFGGINARCLPHKCKHTHTHTQAGTHIDLQWDLCYIVKCQFL